MGKFSSRALFGVLEDDPLTRALLLRPFGGIVLRTSTLNINGVGRPNAHSNLCRKA